MPLLRLLRAHQWVKNIFVFAGIVFARKLTDTTALAQTVAGFGLFCLISSAIYILNDIRDREEDRLHPRKCKRPIAAGEVTVGTATFLSLFLVAASLGLSFLLDRHFFFVIVSYFALRWHTIFFSNMP